MASLIGLASLLAGVVAPVPAATSGSCSTGRSVGVDISQWDEWAFGYHGRAVVQTFLADDTLISALTFWRSVNEDSAYFSLHLLIGETDSTGMPRTDRILVDWPNLLRVDGDGISPTEYRVEFNPPIALARRDTFAIYFVSDPCDGWFNLYMAQNAPYAGGSLWKTWPGGSPCGLRPNPQHDWDWDLCFKLEFCDLVTPVRRETWGRLKLRYR